jgi:ketosteroid isomerase-like protein
MSVEEKQVQEVVAKWQQAHRDLNVDAAVSCVGEALTQVWKVEGRWRARRAIYRTRQEWREWAAAWVRDNPAGTYEVELEFLGTEVDGERALVQTKETGTQQDGRGGTAAWKDQVNTWILARRGGQWKLVGTLGE